MPKSHGNHTILPLFTLAHETWSIFHNATTKRMLLLGIEAIGLDKPSGGASKEDLIRKGYRAEAPATLQSCVRPHVLEQLFRTKLTSK